jgi:hypothetical protein
MHRMTRIKVKASIPTWNYQEGARPPKGPPFRVIAIDEYGEAMTLAERSTRGEARKIALSLKKILKPIGESQPSRTA